MSAILQDLYDSEINAAVETFWDLGFKVRIGDRMNGYLAESTLQDWASVEAWLRATALALYPESQFARGLSA